MELTLANLIENVRVSESSKILKTVNENLGVGPPRDGQVTPSALKVTSRASGVFTFWRLCFSHEGADSNASSSIHGIALGSKVRAGLKCLVPNVHLALEPGVRTIRQLDSFICKTVVYIASRCVLAQ